MRGAIRLFTAVKPVRFIEPGMPTGIAGLKALHSPRSRLLYLYNATLEKLQQVPSSSLYRQSVENHTKHRMAIVESVVPEGWNEWNDEAIAFLKKNRDQISTSQSFVTLESGHRFAVYERGGKPFLVQETVVGDPDAQEWDGDTEKAPSNLDEVMIEHANKQASQFTKEQAKKIDELSDKPEELQKYLETIELPEEKEPEPIKGWKMEPQLTKDQVAEIEDKIGSGLIEELVHVAEGELKLVDIMVQAKVWENLKELPAENQWTYFGRNP